MTLSNIETAIREICAKEHNYKFDSSNPILRLHEPTFGADEIMAALECLLSTKVTMGPQVLSFEKKYASQMGHKYGVMNNSGSSANLLAVAALCNQDYPNYMKPGDEVIVSALSWSTTVWPLIQYGLVPVIVDIDPKTMNIDTAQIERAITSKTRAIMPVHVYGNPCDMDALLSITQKHNLFLIEDCCEALGAKYKDKYVGKFGHVGTFSFYFSHHISTLEGGITVTDDFELSELMKILRAHGWLRDVEKPEKYAKDYPDVDPRFLFVNLGYNLRATELQAAMGHHQLEKLDGFNLSRRKIADRWKKLLAEYSNYMTFQEEQKNGYHTWFGFPITLTEKAPFTVQEIRDYFGRQNIETRPIICGNIAKQPAMKKYNHRVSGDLSHADNVMKNSFSIANHQFVDEEAQQYVLKHLKDFIDLKCTQAA